MIDNPCEKEKKELEKAETDLKTHLADPLNQCDDFPEAFQKETIRLRMIKKEKEETLKDCLEKNKKS